MQFWVFGRGVRKKKCGQILAEKCDKMIGLLEDISKLMEDVKKDNNQILKLKYNQMKLEGKLEKAMKELGFDGDDDENEEGVKDEGKRLE